MKKPEISQKRSINKHNTGLTLYPLQFEEAVKELLKVKSDKCNNPKAEENKVTTK